MSLLKKIILIVLSLLAVLEIVGAVVATKLLLVEDRVYVKPERRHKTKEHVIEATEPFSVLLMGIDTGSANREEKWEGRADSTMLVVVNPKDKQTTVLSISRDLYVELEGPQDNRHTGEFDKLAHMFSYGGAGMSMDTVSKLVDIPVQHHVAINMNGLSQLVDALGGLTVDAKFGENTINGEPETEVLVPDDQATMETMVPSDEILNAWQASQEGYDDIGSTGRAIFQRIKAGKQHMDGRTALNYARYRHGSEGDVGRQRRQREVIQLIMEKLLSMDSLTKYQKILDVVKENLQTDLDFKKLVSIKKSYNAEIFKHVVPLQLQGYGDQLNGVYYMFAPKRLLLGAQNYMRSQMGLPEESKLGNPRQPTVESEFGRVDDGEFMLGIPNEKKEIAGSTDVSGGSSSSGAYQPSNSVGSFGNE